MWWQARHAERWPAPLRAVALGCATVTIGIALLSLLDWFVGGALPMNAHVDFTPMPPATALGFVLLGGALFAGNRHPAPRRAQQLSFAGATLILFVGVLVLAQYLAGTVIGFEAWLSRGTHTFTHARLGRMSPLTAGTFVVASLSLLVLLRSRSILHAAQDVAASAAGVMVVGVLVLMGAWSRTAFPFGGNALPMSLPSAVAFVFLGTGLLAGAKSPVRTWRAAASLAVGLGVGLLASIALFTVVNWRERSHAEGEFQRKAEVLALAFRGGVKDTLEELYNVGALFTVSDDVDRRSFRAFVSQILERQPSVRAFAWSPLVAQRDRARVETAARREGLQTYGVTERYPDGRLGPASRRAEYAPVVYVEPLESRRGALGFDVLSDPVRRGALEKARDTGRAAATEVTMPAGGTAADRGTVIFHPVYRASAPTASVTQRRAALRGFVIETVDLDELLRRALPDPEREGLEFRLLDASQTLSEATLLASARAGSAAHSPLRFTAWITVVDRQWRLELYAAPWYLADKQSGRAWIVMGVGLLVTILLAAYLLASARHAAEVEELAEHTRKVSRALEQSPASVVITDTQGAIEYVNPKFTEITGYAMEEARGRNPRILKSGEMNEETYRNLWATITSGGVWRGEFHNRKKDGELFWEAASISPVRGPDGHITHYVAVKEDITERKRMEDAARFRAHQLEVIRSVTAEITRELNLHTLLSLITQRATELAGAASGGIYLWDDQAQVLVPHAYHGGGRSRERFPRRLGEGLMGCVARDRRGAIVNDYRTSPLAHPRSLETTDITAVLAESLVYRERLLGVLAVHHERGERTFGESDQDVLRLFAAQAAIAIENARLHKQITDHATTLERQVRERTRDLEAALRLAEAAARAKSEFLTNMSHELRTPLNGILGFSDLMLQQGHVLPREKQERFLTNIQTSGRRLLELVTQLLDYTTAESGGLGLERSALAPAAALDDVLAEVRPLATRKGVTLRVEIAPDLPRVSADPARFRQIFFNLLTNAVKFTPRGGSITMAARTMPRASEMRGCSGIDPSPIPSASAASSFVEFSVADTGIGIRPEDVPRLFQKFTQLESAYTKRHAGSGIGLALTKRLVELHGGRIWAESEGEGKGGTFRVLFPVSDLAARWNDPTVAGKDDDLTSMETGGIGQGGKRAHGADR